MAFSPNCIDKYRTYYLYGTKVEQESTLQISKWDLPNLNALNLYNCLIGDLGAWHICNGKWPLIRYLNLGYNNLTSDSLNLIDKAQWLGLEELHLNNNNFSKEIANIEELFNFPKLKVLNFNDSQMSEENISKIKKQSQSLLETLDVESCSISGTKLFHLHNNLGWKNLKILVMGFPQTSDRQDSISISSICSYQLENLTKLSISNSFLSKQSVRHFSHPKWNHLSSLVLYRCGLQVENAKILIRCQWQSLQILNLFNNQIDDSWIDSLGLANWLQLKTLFLRNADTADLRMSNLGAIRLAKLIHMKIRNIDLDSDLLESSNVVYQLFES